MQIRTFEEMEQRVWQTIKRPCVAVYDVPDDPVRYLAKVYDADMYTGIFMRAGELNWITEDIEKHAPWLERAERGAEDDSSLVCVWV